METAKKKNPKLWESIVASVKRGDKGGKKGEWSARKAQLAVKMYKDKGGEYIGAKSKSNSLVKWTKQDWTTKSGKPSLETGERYLPKKAIKSLTPKEYKATSTEKKKSLKKGEQFSKQPTKIAKKVSKFR
jgi:hypothetical protein